MDKKKLMVIAGAFLFIAFITTFNYGGCATPASTSGSSGSNLPAKVTYVSPANGAPNVPQNPPSSGSTLISWNVASGADSYEVYHGTTNPPAYLGNRTATSTYVPSGSSFTFYWRVDSKNSYGVTQGDVWNFVGQ